jgi:uroporphyrinogen decarboxylase
MAGTRPELTHRERVRLALDHQPTDRVPIAMVCSGINRPAREALAAWLERERRTTVEAYLEPLLDIQGVQPAYIGPTLAPGTDYWGVHRSPISYGADSYSEIDHYPLAAASDIDDLSYHTWPDPDWFDYDGLCERVAQLRKTCDPCLMLTNLNVFECSWYMRGFEQMLLDLVLQPELAQAIMARVTDFLAEYARRALEAAGGQLDLVFTADDIGGQNGLLVRRETWLSDLHPYHVRLNQLVHEHGAKVIYHSDGAVIDAVPDLIEGGIDILQALQLECAGMDPAVLKERFGDRIGFEGGVSVQQTLPWGTADDVRREVEHLVRTLGRGGGYICGPSHAIQAGTPPENIVALFDTAAAL